MYLTTSCSVRSRGCKHPISGLQDTTPYSPEVEFFEARKQLSNYS